jgi:septal ring factor EnvC (AmiA/AmiB activator)
MKIVLRRLFVVAGVVASLLVGALSIEAAATWTRAAAPPAAPAVTIASLQAQLDADRARSAQLSDLLSSLGSHSQDLASGLAAAEARIAADLAAARSMNAQLVAARNQLASLKAKMTAAAAAAARGSNAATGSASSATGTGSPGTGSSGTGATYTAGGDSGD